jgi:hypothetical protein
VVPVELIYQKEKKEKKNVDYHGGVLKRDRDKRDYMNDNYILERS